MFSLFWNPTLFSCLSRMNNNTFFKTVLIKKRILNNIILTVATTIGGGSKSGSFLTILMCSIFSQVASSLHHEIFVRTFSGCFTSNQQGPLIFLSRRNVSSDEVLVPNIWEKVRYFLLVGSGGMDAWTR